jgi:RimJ/RimL family protein N-acetyltransferase
LNGYLPVSREHCGPAFLFPDDLPDAPRAVVVTEANRAACDAHFPWVLKEWNDPIHPVVVVIEDGAAVSLCHSARTSPGASEAGLETIEAARGHGYAPEVVAEWARGVRVAGRLPMYSTDWTNAASRRVAEKLGLKLYGEDTALT